MRRKLSDRIRAVEFLEPRQCLAAGDVLSVINLGHSGAREIAPQADGVVVLDWGGRVTRYFSSGTKDSSFGTDGSVSWTGDFVSAQHLEVDRANRVLVSVFDAVAQKTTLARLLPNGVPDASFGVDGSVDVDVLPGTDSILDIVVLTDGSALLTVDGYNGSGPVHALVRYDGNGVRDLSFGDGGGISSETPLVMAANDANITVGVVELTRDHLTLRRYDPAGRPVDAFGVGGVATIGIDAFSNGVSKLALLPGGNVLVGTVLDYRTVTVFRLSADGTVDSEFGDGGKVDCPIGVEYAAVCGIEVQEDQRIIVGMYSHSPAWNYEDQWSEDNTYIARLLPNGEPDTTFKGGVVLRSLTLLVNVALDSNNSLYVSRRISDGDYPHGNYRLGVIERMDVGTPDYAPSDITLDASSVPEGAATGAFVGNLQAVDPDAGDTFTYDLTNTASKRFRIVGSQLLVDIGSRIDYETAKHHKIRIKATDSQGLTVEKEFDIAVTNVNEAPVVTVPSDRTSAPGSVLSLAGITLADPDFRAIDWDTYPLRLSLAADHGTIQFGALPGVTTITGGSGSASVTLEGTLKALRAALPSLGHRAAEDFTGRANLSVDLNDLGHIGEGAPLTDTETLTIQINNPPLARPDQYEILSYQTLRANSYSQAVLESAPAAYWRLGDSGPGIEDSAGDHDGAASAATVLAAPGALVGDPNKSAAFEQANSRILVGGAESLAQPAGAFSLEAWVNPSQSLAWQRIASTRNGPNGGWGFALSNQRLAFTTYGIQDYFLEGHPVPLNQWSHVAVVFDANYDVSFFLNGSFVGKVAGAAPPNPGGGLLAIGDNPDQSAQPFLGKLDEVAFYAKPLSADQVSRHYQAGLLNATVLANDTDADGDPLHAVLAAGPQHGQLTFAADGSFSYKPNAGFYGQDKFTYRAVDAYFQSAETDVLIDVIPVPGDADLDGDVDLADFGILKRHFGAGTTREQGDFNGDGKVDLTDFGILKEHFGTVEPSEG